MVGLLVWGRGKYLVAAFFEVGDGLVELGLEKLHVLENSRLFFLEILGCFVEIETH